MNEINSLNLITPAIIVAIVGYLIHFFGKIIEDQSPYSDDKNWSIELKGVLFILNISTGILGIYLALSKPWGMGNWWLHIITFFVLITIVTNLQLGNKYLGSKFFDIWKKDIKNIEEKTSYLVKKFANTNKYLTVSFVSIILFYFGTLEYLSKNIYFIVLFYIFIFFIFTLLANNSSLKKILRDKIVPVTIHFTDQNIAILEKVVILKYNLDNIRVRSDNKIIILNKNEIFKIEMIIPKELL